MAINLRQLLLDGHAALQEEKAKAEKEKLGIYRIGSVGAVTDDGRVIGNCHRIAMARSLGIETPKDLSSLIMFAAGENNELYWEDKLTASGFKGKIEMQRQIEMEVDGLKVTGRPDVILIDEDGSEFGIELKGIYGTSTAVLTKLSGKPKPEHLVQSAAYSMFMNDMSYALAYTNANWIKPHYAEQKKHGIKNILPFVKIFYLEWRDGVVFYRDEDSDEWVQTVITKEGIKNFYRLVHEMKQEKDLGPRLNASYADGSKNKWGDEGSCTYCDFVSACAKTSSYDDWITEIKQLCGIE